MLPIIAILMSILAAIAGAFSLAQFSASAPSGGNAKWWGVAAIALNITAAIGFGWLLLG